VQRGITKLPYNEEELRLMQRIGRHVERALRLSIRLLDAERTNIGLQEALNHLGVGVFALDLLGRVVFLNAAGESLLGDGLAIVGGRLRIGPSAMRSDIENAIARTLRGELPDLSGSSKPMLIERSNGSWPLTVYVLPVGPVRAPEQEFLTHARAIVLGVLPRPNAPPDAALVRDLLGLTLGEARVASLIGNGLPPREAAKKLGITEETARTTLKRVFSKVGVSRQSELAALLSRLAYR
jgi:DNA-binding CsgD family transcriptional regulator